jgi:AcrR family transcriptional regulator
MARTTQADEQSSTRGERLKAASRQRREHQKQELRQAILDAAADLFVEKGYDQFSLRQVAERIGYSATTIYLYFADKDDLLFTVVDQGFERFEAQLAAAAASTDDPLERLRAIGRAYVRFGNQNPVHYQLMFTQRSDFLMQARSGEAKPRVSAMQLVQQAVQQAMDAGVLLPGDPVAVFDALWSLTHGLVSLSISMPVMTPERAARAGEVALDMAFWGLAVPGKV